MMSNIRQLAFKCEAFFFGAPPEVNRIEELAERSALVHEAFNSSGPYWKAFLVGVSVVAGPAVVRPLWRPYMLSLIPGGPRAALVAEAVLRMTLLVLALWIIFRIRHRYFLQALRRGLRLRGYPVCLSCGYNLEGVATTLCPECGVMSEGSK